MKRFICVMLTILLALGALSACAAEEEPAPTTFDAETGEAVDLSFSVTDLAGRTVEFTSPAATCVSLVPSVTETLYSLGCVTTIIGCDVYSADIVNGLTTASGQLSAEVVGDYNGPDVEKIAALMPEVVFAGAGMHDDAVTRLTDLGIRVVVAEATTVDDIYASMMLIASIFGGDATSHCDALRARLDEIAQKGAALESKPTVYYAMSYGDYGNWAAGHGSYVEEIVELAGGTLAIDEGFEWMEMTLERIVALDPQVILLSDDTGTVEDLSAQNGYKETTAVKNGNVFLVDADLLSRPGPYIADACQTVYDILAGLQ